MSSGPSVGFVAGVITFSISFWRKGWKDSFQSEWSALLLGGKGRAYGMELSAHKNNGRLTGWFSYTLSWSENKIDGINGNR